MISGSAICCVIEVWHILGNERLIGTIQLSSYWWFLVFLAALLVLLTVLLWNSICWVDKWLHRDLIPYVHTYFGFFWRTPWLRHIQEVDKTWEALDQSVADSYENWPIPWIYLDLRGGLPIIVASAKFSQIYKELVDYLSGDQEPRSMWVAKSRRGALVSSSRSVCSYDTYFTPHMGSIGNIIFRLVLIRFWI